jgi:hypothetical protein
MANGRIRSPASAPTCPNPIPKTPGGAGSHPIRTAARDKVNEHKGAHMTSCAPLSKTALTTKKSVLITSFEKGNKKIMVSKIKHSQNGFLKTAPAKYWLLCIFVFSSLIFSTGLFYAYGPEAVITMEYYFASPLSETPEFRERNPDIGILNGENINFLSDNFWKTSSIYADSAYYLMQVESFDLSIAPYKYRILPILFVRLLQTITGLNSIKIFIFTNIAITLLTALIFTMFLIRFFDFKKPVAMLGGILFITMFASTSTIAFPSMEPASFFLSMLIFYAVISKNTVLFLLFSILGVATKEVLAISSLLWFVMTFQLKDKKILLKDTLISIVPVIAFMLIRSLLGGSPLEVNYGYNLLKGEFPQSYGARLFNLSGLFSIAIKTFLSYSFLWLGLLNIMKNKTLMKFSIIIPFVVLASILLSSRITRVLGIIFPVIIPLFLLFFNDLESWQKNTSSIQTQRY